MLNLNKFSTYRPVFDLWMSFDRVYQGLKANPMVLNQIYVMGPDIFMNLKHIWSIASTLLLGNPWGQYTPMEWSIIPSYFDEKIFLIVLALAKSI